MNRLFKEEHGMPKVNRKALVRWAPRLAGIVLFGLAGFVAASQGWINLRAWPIVGKLTARSRETPRPPVNLEPIEEDPELPAELLAAQFEPEEDDPPEVAPAPDGAAIRPAGFDEDQDRAVIPAGDPAASQAEPARPARVAARAADTAQPGAAGRPAPRRTSGSKPAAGKPLVPRETIDAWIADGDFLAAQRELLRWYFQKPALREELLPQLNKMSQAIFFARQPNFHETYEVAPGDQLRTIAQAHHVPWEYIARLNRVDARKIRAGQKLKIVPGPFGAIVTLHRFELVVHCHGMFVKSYPIGIGKDDSTPLGTFAVKQKLVDPTYYGPEGVIRHDDPRNPLGERWIDLGDSYGIHGTIEPESIGKAESRGCIRLLNRDVEEVYDLLIVGSEVRIER